RFLEILGVNRAVEPAVEIVEPPYRQDVGLILGFGGFGFGGAGSLRMAKERRVRKGHGARGVAEDSSKVRIKHIGAQARTIKPAAFSFRLTLRHDSRRLNRVGPRPAL